MRAPRALVRLSGLQTRPVNSTSYTLHGRNDSEGGAFRTQEAMILGRCLQKPKTPKQTESNNVSNRQANTVPVCYSTTTTVATTRSELRCCRSCWIRGGCFRSSHGTPLHVGREQEQMIKAHVMSGHAWTCSGRCRSHSPDAARDDDHLPATTAQHRWTHVWWLPHEAACTSCIGNVQGSLRNSSHLQSDPDKAAPSADWF